MQKQSDCLHKNKHVRLIGKSRFVFYSWTGSQTLYPPLLHSDVVVHWLLFHNKSNWYFKMKKYKRNVFHPNKLSWHILCEFETQNGNLHFGPRFWFTHFHKFSSNFSSWLNCISCLSGYFIFLWPISCWLRSSI